MGRHVVITFKVMAIGWVAIRRPALHQGFQIMADAGVGIFGNGQTTTGVTYKNMGNSRVDRSITDQCLDLVGNLNRSAAKGRDGQAMLFGPGLA